MELAAQRTEKLTSPAAELSGMSRSATVELSVKDTRRPRAHRKHGTALRGTPRRGRGVLTGADGLEAVALEEGHVGVQVVELLGTGGGDEEELHRAYALRR